MPSRRTSVAGVAAIGALPGALDELGTPPAPLLDALHLPRTLFGDPDGLIDVG